MVYKKIFFGRYALVNLFKRPTSVGPARHATDVRPSPPPLCHTVHPGRGTRAASLFFPYGRQWKRAVFASWRRTPQRGQGNVGSGTRGATSGSGRRVRTQARISSSLYSAVPISASKSRHHATEARVRPRRHPASSGRRRGARRPTGARTGSDGGDRPGNGGTSRSAGRRASRRGRGTPRRHAGGGACRGAPPRTRDEVERLLRDRAAGGATRAPPAASRSRYESSASRRGRRAPRQGREAPRRRDAGTRQRTTTSGG